MLLLGEKVARNAKLREVRVQAIRRRLDEGEALCRPAALAFGRIRPACAPSLVQLSFGFDSNDSVTGSA